MHDGPAVDQLATHRARLLRVRASIFARDTHETETLGIVVVEASADQTSFPKAPPARVDRDLKSAGRSRRRARILPTQLRISDRRLSDENGESQDAPLLPL